MNRREFLGEALAVPIAGMAVFSAACGGDDGGGTAIDAGPPNCLANGTAVQVAGGHTHPLQVPVADIQAGSTRTYTLDGDHTHMVTITAAQFGQLAGNTEVMTRSTTTLGHSHPITIRCL
jgi:hypothetical protein